MLEITLVSKNKIAAKDQSTMDILQKGFIGEYGKGKRQLSLSVFEALYLMDVRNASCTKGRSQASFLDIAGSHWKESKFIAKYLTYKDWRERGLIIKEPDSDHKEPNKTPVKGYPSSRLRLPKYKINGTFFQADLTTIVEDGDEAKELYESLWFGQYGSYKASERGKLNKLDAYEALFLAGSGLLTVSNMEKKELAKQATAARKDFPLLYEVYKDWRERGYVIKTGFKFGTHFRLYFPGAKPVKTEGKDWIHSKHVIHVFPRESRLLISEWARAIRVAHSVRKTFILAVPGKKEAKKMKIDFLLYHRKGGNAENPADNPPKYAMLSLGEEEYLGGAELAGAIREAKDMRMELIVAIADRETAVTYYKVRQITLPGSSSEYYEIDWMQP